NSVGSSSVMFNWTVADTTPPALTAPANQTNGELDLVHLALSAVDADTFAATGLPAGLSIDNTGPISGALQAGSVGSYNVTVTAFDGGVSTSVNFNWTVTPAVMAGFSVGGFPNPAVAGVAGSLTVTALTLSGATDSLYRGTVHFTSSDAKFT